MEGVAINWEVFQKYFLPESPSLSKRLYVAFDFDKDNKVGFTDFFEGMVKCLRSSEDERLRCVYRPFFAEPFQLHLKCLHQQEKQKEKNWKQNSPNTYDVWLNEIWNFSLLIGRELAQALYPFQGQDSKELSFQAGDVLIILNKKHEVWWWAQHKENCEKKNSHL